MENKIDKFSAVESDIYQSIARHLIRHTLDGLLQGRGIEEDKGVHGTLKDRLGKAKRENIGVYINSS